MKLCEICQLEFPNAQIVAVDHSFLACEPCAKKHIRACAECDGPPRTNEEFRAGVKKYLDSVLGPLPDDEWRVAFQHRCGHTSVMGGYGAPPEEEQLKRTSEGPCPKCITNHMLKG